LYFRILKNPTPSRLLPSALSGISKFAHLVNIDFFKDLMKTLKEIIQKEEDLAANVAEPIDALEGMSRRLMCIVTAFELLSGQGASFLAK
jgi:nucleolar complex protein 3